MLAETHAALMWSIYYFSQILTKFGVRRRSFVEFPSIRYNENPIGRQMGRWADRHGGANKRLF
jgi:hypothetical protein